jgi:hypothetical protein
VSYLRSIGLWLLMAAAVLAAGCGGEPAARQPMRLKPMADTSPAAAAPMFQVRLVRLTHRMRPDAPVEDLWRLLGTTSVPHEKQSLWEANDLRLGDGARLAADRMNALVAETPDRGAQVSVITIRQDQDFLISIGGERDAIDLLWSDAAGQLMGRRFDRAIAQFRLVCRSDPESPDAVRIALVPEILYGQEAMRWVRAETGVTQRMMRLSFLLTDLAAEVCLPAGRILVLGGRRSSDVSLGGALFYERRGPDVWVQTIVLAAERLRPGQVPEGEAVPFLLPPGVPPKPLPKAATKAPASAAPTRAPAPPAKSPAPPAGPAGPAVPKPPSGIPPATPDYIPPAMP